ncbi:beta-fructofuranosidase, cell wall isozyme-like [Panicum miliaceum]|uniref:Beta-fructofuranosidase, cell wall isozyme-like n=1 Tax=Panicum miliaceum TaxID=4540 RepID=A0A3L6RSP6_PANMI|nr:beta-fructofuranosidase, cell wall isozyme-like [Panicum miliaceum]
MATSLNCSLLLRARLSAFFLFSNSFFSLFLYPVLIAGNRSDVLRGVRGGTTCSTSTTPRARGVAVWGNIVWARTRCRATSSTGSRALEPAIYPSIPSDQHGCWSGSATFLPDGTPAITYTGISRSDINYQVQNIAFPKNKSDPLLREWVKPAELNPIAVPEGDINATQFRDPTTAWYADGHRRMLVGGVRGTRAGVRVPYVAGTFCGGPTDVDLMSVAAGAHPHSPLALAPPPAAGHRLAHASGRTAGAVGPAAAATAPPLRPAGMAPRNPNPLSSTYLHRHPGRRRPRRRPPPTNHPWTALVVAGSGARAGGG